MLETGEDIVQFPGPTGLRQEQEGDIDQDQDQIAGQVTGFVGDGRKETLSGFVEQQFLQCRRTRHVHHLIHVRDHVVDPVFILSGVAPKFGDAICEQRHESEKSTQNNQDRENPGVPDLERARPIIDHRGKALDDEEQEHSQRKGREDAAAKMKKGQDDAGRDDPDAGLRRAIHNIPRSCGYHRVRRASRAVKSLRLHPCRIRRIL